MKYIYPKKYREDSRIDAIISDYEDDWYELLEIYDKLISEVRRHLKKELHISDKEAYKIAKYWFHI